MTDVRPDQRGVISGVLNLSRNLGLITGASANRRRVRLRIGTQRHRYRSTSESDRGTGPLSERSVTCPTVDPPQDDPGSWLGDGKIVGEAVEVSDSARVDEAHRFRIEITAVVLTTVGTPTDHLLIQHWHPGRGLQRQKRG